MSVPQPAHCFTAAVAGVIDEDGVVGTTARPAAVAPLPPDVISAELLTCGKRWPTNQLVSHLQPRTVSGLNQGWEKT